VRKTGCYRVLPGADRVLQGAEDGVLQGAEDRVLQGAAGCGRRGATGCYGCCKVLQVLRRECQHPHLVRSTR
jgi:hypothetical protein